MKGLIMKRRTKTYKKNNITKQKMLNGHSANIMNTSAYVQGWQAKALQVVSLEKVCKLAERIFETFTTAQQEQVKAS